MYFFVSAIILYVLDQTTKFLIVKHFCLGQSVPVIKPILYFTYIHNKGAAFGLFPQISILLTLVSLSVVALFIIFSYKIIRLPVIFQILLGLILGGAAGNLTDRLRLGYVVDFIDFRVWPVFNLADSALTVAFACLIIILIKNENNKMINKKTDQD